MIDFNWLMFFGGIVIVVVLCLFGVGLCKVKLLFGVVVFFGVLYFVLLLIGVENYDFGVFVGVFEYMNGIWYLLFLMIGVGYFVGCGGFFFIVGGFVCYWLFVLLFVVIG